MATTTTNLGLSKPAYSDDADVAVINGNMDILDTKIGAVGNTSVQTQINNNSDAIANLNNKYFALDSATSLQNGTNFNTLTTAGCWRILSYSSASSMTNIPKALAGTLYIKNSMLETGSNYIQQIYITHQTEIFLRYTTDKGSTWSAWQELAAKDDIISEQKTFNNIAVSGNSYADIDVNVVKTGYKGLGVAGWQINGVDMVVTIYCTFISASVVRIRVRNLSSNAQTITSGNVNIIYKKA